MYSYTPCTITKHFNAKNSNAKTISGLNLRVNNNIQLKTLVDIRLLVYLSLLIMFKLLIQLTALSTSVFLRLKG